MGMAKLMIKFREKLSQLSTERLAVIQDMWFAIQMSVNDSGEIEVKHITREEFFRSPDEIESDKSY
jgi:hypothetical protein